MSDRFASHAGSLEAPASGGFPISPSDSTDLVEVTRAVYIGTGGAIAGIMQGGEEVTFISVPGGTLLPVRLRRIKATGTTATALVGLV